MKKSKKGGSSKNSRRHTEEHDDDFLSGSKKNFTYEPSDSEDDYSQQEKMLLEKVRSSSSQIRRPKKMAIMDLPASPDDDSDVGNGSFGAVGEIDYNDSDEDENMDSDIEGKEDDLNLPDQRAWGKTRKNYYNTDYVDQDYGGFDGEDAEAAELEEQEAMEIQKRLAAELDDNDFTLDVFTKSKEGDDSDMKTSEEVIKTDLSQLSSRQKLSLLQKEAPELIGIITEFRDMMKELLIRLGPGMRLVEEKKVNSSPLVRYIRTKYHLVNNYVLNMGFYLLLRARRLPVTAHPVVKRLLQYRQLLQQLQPLESPASKQLDELLSAAESGFLTVLEEDEAVSLKQKEKRNLRLLSVTKEMKQGETNDIDMSSDSDDDDNRKLKDKVDSEKLIDKSSKSLKKKSSNTARKMPWENTSDFEDLPWNSGITNEDIEEKDVSDSEMPSGIQDTEDDNKRAITWQMAKNKGLTPHRKKEQRNPRVKHRNKFRKAKVRRKGQVREPRTELKRYGGELSGIKMSVSKSIKIK